MTHPREIDVTAVPSGAGCVECDATGAWWVHLRRCAECGHIGCCDASLFQHASAHVVETGHTIIQSFEPGEEWFYSYEARDFHDGPTLAPPQSHPYQQPVPGPEGRVPVGWQEMLRDRGASAAGKL